ncbi:MAG: beta-class carbonic anhydrase [Candidatus Methylomirabilales bacterium]
MGLLEDCVRANQAYVATFGDRARLDKHPAKHLVVVTCMDCRIQVEEILGLKVGDAHILRNGGGIVTDDVIRSLILSYRFLGTREIFVINHTGCGLLGLYDDQLRKELAMETGTDTGGLEFFGFRDLESNVRRQLEKIRESPFIPKDIAVHGLIYNVKTGQLQRVME